MCGVFMYLYLQLAFNFKECACLEPVQFFIVRLRVLNGDLHCNQRLTLFISSSVDARAVERC